MPSHNFSDLDTRQLDKLLDIIANARMREDEENYILPRENGRIVNELTKDSKAKEVFLAYVLPQLSEKEIYCLAASSLEAADNSAMIVSEGHVSRDLYAAYVKSCAKHQKKSVEDVLESAPVQNLTHQIFVKKSKDVLNSNLKPQAPAAAAAPIDLPRLVDNPSKEWTRATILSVFQTHILGKEEKNDNKTLQRKIEGSVNRFRSGYLARPLSSYSFQTNFQDTENELPSEEKKKIIHLLLTDIKRLEKQLNNSNPKDQDKKNILLERINASNKAINFFIVNTPSITKDSAVDYLKKLESKAKSTGSFAFFRKILKGSATTTGDQLLSIANDLNKPKRT